MNTCEQCRAKPPAESYALMDYCATCGNNLCDKCMQQGCCGQIPARSGSNENYGEDKHAAPAKQ